MLCEEDVEGNAGVLDLSMRGWRTLDEAVLTKRARIVQLEHNNLTALPGKIGTLTMMVKLDVSHNMLAGLPAELGDCTRLVKLKCDNNHIPALPSELAQCRYLEELYANSNRLTTVPEELGQLEMLRVMELRSNRLEKLPYQIGGIETLEVLDCGHNDDLDAVPAAIRDDPHMVDFAMKLHYKTMRHYLDIRKDYDKLQTTLFHSEETNMRLRDDVEVLKQEKQSALHAATAGLCAIM